MTFVPKIPDSKVNIPKQSQLLEFFYLVGGLAAIFIAVYMLLGLVVDLAAPYIPEAAEEKIAELYAPKFETSGNPEAQIKIQKLTDSLSSYQNGKKYKVSIIPSAQVNALAVPGGNIMVFAGLLKEVKTENELAFVLAHELGHFENRDQLRGIGRALILFILSLAFTGSDSGITNLTGQAIKNVQMKFSRDQERKADAFALDLLVKKYGNAAGAASMLARFGPLDDKYPRWMYYFVTHPYYKDRIEAVEKRMKKSGYALRGQLPLDPDYSSVKAGKGERYLTGF